MIRSLLTRKLRPSVSGDLFNCLRFCSTAGGGTGKLEGKVALITGGGNGIGKATAHEFIQQGAQVIIADIDSLTGQITAHELGPKAQFLPCDVAVEAQVAQAVETAVSQHGKLDIMYNNAGISGSFGTPSITDLDLDDFDNVMRINVRGIVAGIKHAARVMIPTGSGSILCTSSICGLMGGIGPHPYTISKFAVSGIVKSVATELCKTGIRINCISPTYIPTQMPVNWMARLYPKATKEQIVGMLYNLGELKGEKCEEKDIAKAALYLGSDESKFITGHNLVVDGGFTCFKSISLPSPDQFM